MMDSDLLTVRTWQEFFDHYQRNLPIVIVAPFCHQPSAPVLIGLVEKMVDQDAAQRPDAESVSQILKQHGGQH